MLLSTSKPGQLIVLVESLLHEKYTGILNLTAHINGGKKVRKASLILREGNFIFADAEIPTSEQLCQSLGNKVNPSLINAAILVVKQRINNVNSYQEYIDLALKIKVFTEEDLQTFILKRATLILEVFNLFAVVIKEQEIGNFDLFTGGERNGLSWSQLKQKIRRRQQKWADLLPQIPQIDAVPYIATKQPDKISEPQVRQHLLSSVDGNQSLLDIAAKMDKDPLKVAKTYASWVERGWVNFRTATEIDHNLPLVLSVDDSPIIQAMIRRSLEDTYQVICCDRANKALEILDRQTVSLMLLDLTMPDVDGLEFCQMVRKMPKFADLPIIMVTARDGLVDRARGHFAGTDRYLTKPFKAKELRDIVNNYIGQSIAVS